MNESNESDRGTDTGFADYLIEESWYEYDKKGNKIHQKSYSNVPK